MGCERFTSPDGKITGFMCSRGGRSKPCSFGGCKRKGTFLCDYPVKRGEVEGTCDRASCGAHSDRVGPDRHYCRAHAQHDAKQKAAAEPGGAR